MSPTLATVVRALHVTGVVMWIGGMIASLVAAATAARASEASRREVLAAARAPMLGVATPGLVMAWAFGLWVLLSGWESYRAMGWIHAKVTVAVAIATMHGMASARLRKASSGGEVKAGMLRAFAIATAVLALGAVFLVLGKPF